MKNKFVKFFEERGDKIRKNLIGFWVIFWQLLLLNDKITYLAIEVNPKIESVYYPKLFMYRLISWLLGGPTSWWLYTGVGFTLLFNYLIDFDDESEKRKHLFLNHS